MDYKVFLNENEINLLPPLEVKDTVILASASPRRRELMPLIADKFEVIVSGAEEVSDGILNAEQLPEYFAVIKADAVSKLNKGRVVVGCDTAVFLNGRMLGKPCDEDDAYSMLKALSGNTHKVISGVCITDSKQKVSFSVKTLVTFRKLGEKEIRDYIASGTPFDKAGGYGIQGAAGEFVDEVQGSCYNVIGFPVVELRNELCKFLQNIGEI